jgi:hypothetical protein
MNHEHHGTEYNRAASGESNKEALYGRKWGNCNVKHLQSRTPYGDLYGTWAQCA